MSYFLQPDDDRKNLKFDGDYSQLISINSELGVAAFQSTNYPDFNDPTKQNPMFIGCDGTIGIFFSSDTQNRDYISPRRILRNEMKTILVADDLPINTQQVPFYLWQMNRN